MDLAQKANRVKKHLQAAVAKPESTSIRHAIDSFDAFVDGGERRVDLGEVNGRVFVNNVSLGLYAEAVQQEGYRDAKIRTVLDTVPTVLGPEATSIDECHNRRRDSGGSRLGGGEGRVVRCADGLQL